MRPLRPLSALRAGKSLEPAITLGARRTWGPVDARIVGVTLWPPRTLCADRQLQVFKQTGDLRAVVRWLVDETRAGHEGVA